MPNGSSDRNSFATEDINLSEQDKDGIISLTAANKSDSLAVIARCFDDDACCQAEKLLRNPLVESGETFGDVAYYKGMAVGTQSAIKRKLFLNGKSFNGTIGAMLGMDSDAPVPLLVGLMKATMSARWNRQLYFANTAIPVSMKMNRLLGVKGEGVESCGVVRFAILKPVGFLNFVFKNRIPRTLVSFFDWCCALSFRMMRKEQTCKSIDPKINDFWQEYLKTSRGVVSSRSAEELDWAFGDDLKVDKAVMIAESDQDSVVGYIIIKESRLAPGRWLVVDWIALRDDKDVLKRLLVKAKRYLQQNGSAFMLESIGFPMRAQSIIGSVLSVKRKAPNNSFIYKAFNKELEEAIKSDQGWFFGPYDGDRFLS